MNRDWNVKKYHINDDFNRFKELFYDDMYEFNKDFEEKKRTESIQDKNERLLEMKKLDIQFKQLENEAEVQLNKVSMQPYVWMIGILVTGAIFYLILRIKKQDNVRERSEKRSRNRPDQRTSMMYSQV